MNLLKSLYKAWKRGIRSRRRYKTISSAIINGAWPKNNSITKQAWYDGWNGNIWTRSKL